MRHPVIPVFQATDATLVFDALNVNLKTHFEDLKIELILKSSVQEQSSVSSIGGTTQKIVRFFDSPEGFRGIRGESARENWGQENSPHDLSSTNLPCPKFDRCSAPVSASGPNWRDSVYCKGEPTCYYMRLHAKNVLEGQKQGSVPSELRIG